MKRTILALAIATISFGAVAQTKPAKEKHQAAKSDTTKKAVHTKSKKTVEVKKTH